MVTRNIADNSTSNLNKHICDCRGDAAIGNQTITAFAAGCTYRQEAFRALLVKWIAGCCRPFQIVEDEPLCQAFKMLYSRVEIPSASTVARDVRLYFCLSRQKIQDQLKVHSLFSLCRHLLYPPFHIATLSLIEIIVLSIIDILFRLRDRNSLRELCHLSSSINPSCDIYY